MLRIERSGNSEVVFTLSGRMQAADIEQFQRLLIAEAPGQSVTFDLRDVTLVNQDAVTFSPTARRTESRLSGVLSMSETGSIKRKRRNKQRQARTEILNDFNRRSSRSERRFEAILG